MKKVFIVFILVAFLPVCLLADVSAPYEHYMLGYVNAKVDFSVTMLEEVLPFDLSGSEVAYNSNYGTTINGLRIGEYTLVSNSAAFQLFIAHTPLVLKSGGGTNDPGTEEEIDYRLYSVVSSNLFFSTVSDSNASNPESATNNILISGADSSVWPEGTVSLTLVNKSLYVSLDEGSTDATSARVDALKSGTYESTIYFILKGQ